MPSMRRFVSSVAAVAAVVYAVPAVAQPATQAGLRARVEALEKEVTELRAAAAQTSTLSQAITELSARVAGMQQELELLRRERASMPEAVATIDELRAAVRALERELEGLRTQVADLQQPAAQSGGVGDVRHDGAFSWQTADGRYGLELGGYLQARFVADLSEDIDDVREASFRVRRGRVGASGHVWSEDLRFKLLAELATSDAPLRDYYLDYELADWLILRGGQTKIPFSRGYLTSSRRMAFPERDVATEALRYDRDVGAWAHGALWDDRARYYAGVSNGAGRNARNDNIDFAVAARGELAILGEYIDHSHGDLEGSGDLRLTVGVGGIHDLVRLPERVAGIELGQRDVDANGVFDNVRVWSASADAVARWRRFELAAELLWRQERWGTILAHSDNAAVADAVRPGSDGVKNYLGGYGQLTYVLFPREIVAGVRVGRARLPLLGVGGRRLGAPPPAGRAWEVSGTAQLYRRGYRFLGFDYTFTNYDAVFGADPTLDKEHRFTVESQLVW